MVKKAHTDANILRAARKRIERKKNDHICYAIDKVKIGTVEQKTKLLRWIMSMLAPHFHYGKWLLATGHENDKESSRAGRLAWLDWMIAECEKEQSNG
jgi:hypothetical protein